VEALGSLMSMQFTVFLTSTKRAQGKYLEAESLYRKALDFALESLGSKDSITLTYKDNLALIL
jgi:hypothetical protein